MSDSIMQINIFKIKIEFVTSRKNDQSNIKSLFIWHGHMAKWLEHRHSDHETRV